MLEPTRGRFRFLTVSLTLPLFFVFTPIAAAQMQITRAAFSSGGAILQPDGNYGLGATLAEDGIAGAPVAGGGFTLHPGFWGGVTGFDPTSLLPDEPDEPGPGIVFVNALFPSAPNPFRSKTTIAYTVAQESPIRLHVFDVAGRHVTTLVNAVQGPGRYEIFWNGVNGSGSRMANGIYFYRLNIGDWSQTRKLLKLR